MNQATTTGNGLKTWKTARKSLYLCGLQAIQDGRQIGDRWKTTEDSQIILIPVLSSLSSIVFIIEDSCRPRIYWLSSMSSMSSRKTTYPTPNFDHPKTTKAPYLLEFTIFSPSKNMQKEVVFD
ncbi:hypothetical protein [Pseudomonas sp. P8_241]|uniref:hypothetical protein n=1 Tax=Pseudomonas sp. P8_241 TaxID=3043445 RepID=UPI002A365F52|nr:hypothetical protein [Pseudomonas sp. P8_241]WPN49069.1 hypothetical protein QMK58_10480 [Pseudomonas sp. P8_241]